MSEVLGIEAFLRLAVDQGETTDEGIRLPTERELASMSGLSRTTVREYLAALQVIGLLDKVQGSGNVIRRDNRMDGLVYDLMIASQQVTLADISQARELYEIGMISHVARVIADDDVSVLETLVDEMVAASAADRHEAALQADLDFHNKLFAILDNPIVSQSTREMQASLRALLADRRLRALEFERDQNGGHPLDCYATDVIHYEITEALKAHDDQAATSAMRRHFDQWRGIVGEDEAAG